MLTRGRDLSMREKRGRSPLLPRKIETGQHMRSLNPPTLERKNALTSTELRKIPIYDKHTVSSILYAQSHVRLPLVDKTKLAPQSKFMSLRSKFNEKHVTNSYTNTTSLTKTADVRKPGITNENENGKKQENQPTNGSESKNPSLFDALISPSKDDHNIVTHEENLDKQRMDQNTAEADTCSENNVTIDEPRISIEHTDDDHDDSINQQDQPDKTSDHDSNEHHHHFEVDQDNQEPEEEQAVQEVIGSKDVEHEEMEPKPWEPNIKEGGEEVPKEEECTSIMVKNHEVVAHGKKETAAYDYAIEVTLSKLREQRLNRVKALVGRFETLISLESDAICNTRVIKSL